MPQFSLKNKKAFVLDLDGTIYLGKIPFVDVIDFINDVCGRFEIFFMTNNTSVSKDKYVDKLTNFGIKNVSPSKIITPADTVLNEFSAMGIKTIYCVGTNQLVNWFRENGLIVFDSEEIPNEIEALVLGYDTTITYTKIKSAGLLLYRKNVRYFATHPDVVCPSENGGIPDVGSFIAMFESSNGRIPEKIYGKPDVSLLAPVSKKFSAHEIIVAGDRLYTDKVLADNAGIDFVQVLSGESTKEEAESLEKKPAVTLKNLAELRHYL